MILGERGLPEPLLHLDVHYINATAWRPALRTRPCGDHQGFATCPSFFDCGCPGKLSVLLLRTLVGSLVELWPSALRMRLSPWLSRYIV